MIRVVLTLSAVLTVCGCGWYRDDKGIFVNRSDDYLTTVDRETLVVPTDLDNTKVVDPFPIPRTPDQLNAQYFPGEPPRPDAIYANNNRDEVRIQRLSDRRWLVIPEPPTTVWPKVKQFLADNGISSAREVPEYGRINTRWLDISDEEAYRDVIRLTIREAKQESGLAAGQDRLLIRVEQGLREQNSEIQLRYENNGLSTVRDDVVDLNEVESSLIDVEIQILNDVGAYIAAKVAEQTVSKVAQEISTGVKSSLRRDDDGEPVLLLKLDYERAWATVGQALERAEVQVNSLDQVQGVYDILIPKSVFTGEKKGWLGGMLSRGKDGYELVLRVKPDADSVYHVTVHAPDESPVDSELSQQVLSMIREYAS